MTDWSAFFNAFMERIAYTAPVIFTCVVGMIVAVIKINQDRKPAILVVIAVTIMFIAEMIYTAIQSYWITNSQVVVFGFPIHRIMKVASVIWLWALAIGIGTLIYAVFVARKTPPRLDE